MLRNNLIRTLLIVVSLCLPIMMFGQTAEECYKKGGEYYNNNKFKKAFKWYQKAAIQGFAKAQTDLGYMYQNGCGVMKNKAKAVEWFQKAANQGVADAQNKLGNMYYDGDVVTQDYSKAIEWYQKAAYQENAYAQTMLGVIYEYGRGVPQDYQTAKTWYLRAIEKGPNDTAAKHNLARVEKKIAEQTNNNYAQNTTITTQSQVEPQPKVEPKIAPKPKVEPKPQAESQPKVEQKTVEKTVSSPTPSKVTITNVDKDIPVSGLTDKNTFVVVIGNEKYEEEADVPFAENDAKIFAEYCRKTLGISEKHIRSYVNAGYNDIRKAVSWLKQGLSAYEGDGRVIFYYAGHGIPNETDKSAYLLPVDGIGSDIESAYSLSKLYQSLSELPSKSVLVFLDACFSGAKREGGMMASARGVAIKVRPDEAKGKMVVFTAAQGDETAYPFKSQQHGMFTYYLLKILSETKGQVTLGELGDYLRREVKRESFDENNKIQTPSVNASSALANSWRSIKLR